MSIFSFHVKLRETPCTTKLKEKSYRNLIKKEKKLR